MKKIILSLVGFTAFAFILNATGPAWWTEQGVIETNATTNDYAVANVGQAKNMAYHAIQAMNSKFAAEGGAGFTFNSLVDPNAQANDYAALNVGQLKALVAPFYDRLADMGWFGTPPPSWHNPWSEYTFDDNDYTAANVGQLKFLFSFDFENPGMPFAVISPSGGPASSVPGFIPPSRDPSSSAPVTSVTQNGGKLLTSAAYMQSSSVSLESIFGGIGVGLFETGGGWYYSPMFGFFAPSDVFSASNHWVYHESHKWVWIEGPSTNNFWFYDTEGLGWLWTNQASYAHEHFDENRSFLYWNNGGTWIYYDNSTGVGSAQRSFTGTKNNQHFSVPGGFSNPKSAYMGFSKTLNNNISISYSSSDFNGSSLYLGEGWITTESTTNGTKMKFVPDTTQPSRVIYFGRTSYTDNIIHILKGYTLDAGNLATENKITLSTGWISAFVDNANPSGNFSIKVDRTESSLKQVYFSVKRWPNPFNPVSNGYTDDTPCYATELFDFQYLLTPYHQFALSLAGEAWVAGPNKIIPNFDEGPKTIRFAYFDFNGGFTGAAYEGSGFVAIPITTNGMNSVLTNPGPAFAGTGYVIGKEDAQIIGVSNGDFSGFVNTAYPDNDFDGDGLLNKDELLFSTDPNSRDTDGDSFTDDFEYRHWPLLNPLVPDDFDKDSDGDGLSDGLEYAYDTDPNNKDTDFDGIYDGDEIIRGSNPVDPVDAGEVVPEGERLEIKIQIGDESGSESEQYNLIIAEILDSGSEVIVGRFPGRKGGLNEYYPKNLRRDASYVMYMDWIGGKADYDYTLNIEVVSPDYTRTLIEPPGWTGTYSDDGDPNDPNSPNPSQPYAMVSRGDVPGGGFPSKYEAYLLNIKLSADEGKIHHGFDPPLASEGDPANEYWASVVQGGTNTIVNVEYPNEDDVSDGFEWKIKSGDEAFVQISQGTVNNGKADLTLTGYSTAGDSIYEATIDLVAKGSNVKALTLKVMVLPRIGPIGLGVYNINDSSSANTIFSNSPSIPYVNASAIVDACNDSFRQAGIDFYADSSSGNYISLYDTKSLVWDATAQYWLQTNGQDGRFEGSEYFNILNSGAWTAEIDLYIVKLSGIPYQEDNFNTLFARGIAGTSGKDLVLAASDSISYINWVAAHEIGHLFDLASRNDDDGKHDQPPYPPGVTEDTQHLSPPSAPPGHLSTPNSALMQSGSPIGNQLPWIWGRWMRHEDWKLANEFAFDNF